MPEKVVPGPICEERAIREAVCIHTRKIFDSCKDKDCIDCLRVYPTRSSQEALDRAMTVKAGSAQLLCAYIDVEPVSFSRGFYSVDVRYFYRITADAFAGGTRPTEITGLAVFDKRVILYGGEGGAKTFTSEQPCSQPGAGVPVGVVEAVDPLLLGLKLVDVCDCRGMDNGCAEIPDCVAGCFQEPLQIGGEVHRLYVTLGQFSIIRLERDTQLLMPVYDYCMPEKECACDGDSMCPKDPCEVFRKVKFPVHEFFPQSTAPLREEGNGLGCGCC